MIAPLLLGLLAAAPAFAADGAEDCVRTKVWDSYSDGWQVRASASARLAFGKTHHYRVSMLKGRTYRVVSCGERNVKNLDVLVYDADGNVVKRDETTDREPTFSYEPDKTGVYYLVLYVRDASDRAKQNDVAFSLVHR